jgi:hypothetical protein
VTELARIQHIALNVWEMTYEKNDFGSMPYR